MLTEDSRKDVGPTSVALLPVSGFLWMDCLNNCVSSIIYYVSAKLYNQIKMSVKMLR